MTIICEEIAWMPMRTANGKPFFFHASIKDRRRDAMDHFVDHCRTDWRELRKEGWRIVRVRITTEIHQ